MPEDPDEIGQLLGLIVHDLRNPAATLSANLAYLRESAIAVPASQEEDVQEALGDMETGVSELMRGLEHLAWIARWLSNTHRQDVRDGDVATSIEVMATKNRRRIQLGIGSMERPLHARGGATIGRLLEILAENAERHARGRRAQIDAVRQGEHVLVSWSDEGPAVAPELRQSLFTVKGQHDLKVRRDGRYGRFAGLLALHVGVEALGGRVECAGEDGASIFRIYLPVVSG